MRDLVSPTTLLRDLLDGIDLTLPLDGVDLARTTRHELVGQLDDYLLPRLGRLDAPLLVVLGGSTGAGKSTITNSLVGSEVSMAGVLRPSTRTPVLVCRDDDLGWFADGGILPDLPRTSGDRPLGAGLHMMTVDTLPPGLALLDAPDIDSVETTNHELAAKLLGAADVWLFVTTASRYADAVPWEYLRRARDRSVAMAMVVNRLPPGTADEVLTHLNEMLHENGLPDVVLFPIGEANAADEMDDGRLLPDSTANVSNWLHQLVSDDAHRDDVVRSTLDGVLDSLPERITHVQQAALAQSAAVDDLRATSHRSYEAALEDLDDELGTGALLRGEVLDRWREHVGTSAFMDRLQQGVGTFRNWLRSVVTRKPVESAEARDQLESNLATLVRNHADRAALATVSDWESRPGGAAVLAHAEPGIDRPTDGLASRLDRELEAWQLGVMQLVEDLSSNKVAVARALSLGLNSVGVAVMIGVFSQTGGVTGAEAGVAAGTAAVSQTLLTAVFGENAVRDLVQRSRDDLRLRLAGLFEVERARFDVLLAPFASTTSEELGEAGRAIEAARR